MSHGRIWNHRFVRAWTWRRHCNEIICHPINFISSAMLRIVATAALPSLLLIGCGGDASPVSQTAQSAVVMSGRSLAQQPAAASVQSVQGERRSYVLSWNGQLVGQSQVPQLTDFKLPGPELRLQDVSLGFDREGTTAQLYRLYQAAFNRVPDVQGFGYWRDAMDHRGLTLRQLASEFLASAESETAYGKNPDDAAYLTRLYRNVLKRDTDSDGYVYWKATMAKGVDRVDVLMAFASSPENKQATAASIDLGMAYAEPSVAYIPVANAIGPRHVVTATPFKVDGTTSTDANGDAISFSWTVTAAPPGSGGTSMVIASIATPTLTFNVAGDYEVTLWVKDGTSLSYSPMRLPITAHTPVVDTGTYKCATLDRVLATELFSRGHTYLDRDHDGKPCEANDIAVEKIVVLPVPMVADTGLYKCATISHSLAVSLFQAGHTYLDRDHDGEPCEATDITWEYLNTPSPPSTPSTGMCWVNGYTRKNGTHVSGYWRRC